MKQKTYARFVSDWATSIASASATRTFLTIAILSVAASLYWSAGAAAKIGAAGNPPYTTTSFASHLPVHRHRRSGRFALLPGEATSAAPDRAELAALKRGSG